MENLPTYQLPRTTCIDIYRRLGKTYAQVRLTTMQQYIKGWYNLAKGDKGAAVEDVNNDSYVCNEQYQQ